MSKSVVASEVDCWVRGYRDAERGVDAQSCPFEDEPANNGKPRAERRQKSRAWRRGWGAFHRGEKWVDGHQPLQGGMTYADDQT